MKITYKADKRLTAKQVVYCQLMDVYARQKKPGR